MTYAKRTLSALFIAFAAVAVVAQTSSMQDLPYPNDTKTIILPGGTEIAYIDRGQGPYTLVFVHGLGTYFKSWQNLVNAQSMENRCIALDLPGYGKSSKGDYPFSMQFFAEQIEKIVPQYTHVFKVKPGITSLGMVKYGYASTVEEMVKRLKYDLIYIENMSMVMDMKILIYTVKTVLYGKGK